MKAIQQYIIILLVAMTMPILAFAQEITTPPSGGNQKSVVTQYMGFVAVTITYNSPDVHSPSGKDRTGSIWGEVVPYGTKNLKFGWSTNENPSPWRAGANESTTISFSEDVRIEGQLLKAGTYGLFVEPGKENWVFIFSTNSTSWGSYFYSKDEDALRVTVPAVDNSFEEYLTYEFSDRKLASCVASLKWENKMASFQIEVPDFKQLYIDKMSSELRSQAGFDWKNWVKAAQFCITYNTHLEQALEWADFAIYGSYVGEENFTTFQTKGLVLLALGRNEEAKKWILKAVNHPTAAPGKVHQFGRGLIKKGHSELALEVFKANYKQNNGQWPTNVGMARGYSAMGDYKTASKYVKKALKIVPDEDNKQNLEKALILLAEGKDIN